MRLSVLVLTAMLSLAASGCQTMADIAKGTAKDIWEQEKPKIRAAISQVKEEAISQAKEMAKDLQDQAVEKATTVARDLTFTAKTSFIEALEQKLAQMRNTPSSEKTLLEEHAGEGILMLILTLLGISEKRKADRDKEIALLNKVKNGGA